MQTIVSTEMTVITKYKNLKFNHFIFTSIYN